MKGNSPGDVEAGNETVSRATKILAAYCNSHTVDLPDAVKLGGSYDGGWLLQCVYRVA